MIFPLLLCKMKPKNDVSSSKTQARRLKEWTEGDLNDLHNQERALKKLLTKVNRQKTEIEDHQLNKLTNAEKISNASAKLTDASKSFFFCSTRPFKVN